MVRDRLVAMEPRDEGGDGAPLVEADVARIGGVKQKLVGALRVVAGGGSPGAHGLEGGPGPDAGERVDDVAGWFAHGRLLCVGLSDGAGERRAGRLAPAESGRDLVREKLDRAQDELVRRVDRMDLHGNLGRMFERSVARQALGHLVGRADMAVEGAQEIVQAVAEKDVSLCREMGGDPPQPGFGEAPRVVAPVGDEDAARGEDAGAAPAGRAA